MKRSYFYILFMILSFIPGTVYAYAEEECIECHAGEGKQNILQISMKEFRESIHGEDLTCQDCHIGVEGEDHEVIKSLGAVDCGQCHEQENRHGSNANEEDRPQCYSCHGKHKILSMADMLSEDHMAEFVKSCENCHPVECGDVGYFSWFLYLQLKSHKKQDFGMNYDRTNCIGCHQGEAAHGENIMLDDQNCSICHMDMKGHHLLTGYIHPRADLKEQPGTFMVAIVYQVFILFVLLGLVKYIVTRFSYKPKKKGR